MIPFHSLYVASKQDYLHSIHFYSFLFLYFKTSNRGYLISLHSFLFHSFHLLKDILFHSILSMLLSNKTTYIPFIFIHFHSFILKHLNERKQNGYKEIFISLYSFKISNFHSFEIGRRSKIRLNKFFTKTLKIPLYIQFFILKYESNSNIVIK